MDESYYTDEMRKFVASVDNKHDINVSITQMGDDDGPYLCVVFDKNEVGSRGENNFKEIAEFLVDLRNGLIDRGARVTFLVTGAEE